MNDRSYPQYRFPYPRRARVLSIAFALAWICSGTQLIAQQPQSPSVPGTAAGPVPVNSSALPSTNASNAPSTATPSPTPPTIPSLEKSAALEANKNVVPKPVGRYDLPSNQGQYWVEYDIRPYTQSQKNVERPQQAIIDWIIRETGSDVWFNEPVGVLTSDRTTLRVYHHSNMQKTVSQIYERFVNGVTEPQVYGLRLITIGNPNWRNKASALMKSAHAQSPGVQVWLMPKENSALFLSQLRERVDVREMQSVDLPFLNGQTQSLEQLRSRTYLKEYQVNQASTWPPFTPVSDDIKEGYKLQISPLMTLDGRTVDLMLKCEIDQVERLNNVSIDLPMPLGQPQTVQIDVPQLVSWRLHERFRWPANQVLLLSCGVVAAPTGQVNNTLLGGSPPTLFGLNRILPSTGNQRTDAILMIEYRGPVSTQINMGSSPAPVTNPATANTNTASSQLSRGRY